MRSSAGSSRRCARETVTWHAKGGVRVEEVPDPTIEEPTDLILRMTSSGICGSDLHL